MSTIETTLASADSLHPHLKVAFTLAPEDLTIAQSSTCVLDTIFTLPPDVFVDRYQVKDIRHTLGNAVLVYGESNLELPVSSIGPEGSIVIVRKRSDTVYPDEQVHIDLPIHVRYQPPTTESDRYHVDVHLPPVYMGWTCLSTRLDSVRSLNDIPLPFNLHPLVPSSHIATQFHPIKAQAQDALSLRVPVGRMAEVQQVGTWTVVTVLAGVIWLLSATVRAVRKRSRRDAKGKRKRSD
ncbi:hypothetical protein BZG36_03519 [Bifiguratus adelaidae]|uniref:Protein PBN1 n=1 Tax=Bifiguratus adelaidae TaxID=1938954 RepID=A0A261XYD8_9FUNG|nr:hypothetical protein BZG36_03519 [Bifiguratus adelaidae]